METSATGPKESKTTLRGEANVLNHHVVRAMRMHVSRLMRKLIEMFGADLETGLVADPGLGADDLVMLNELRIFCTMAMLLCLDINHRAAYVLGDILEFDHREASEILEITTDNYRKRLSRARSQVIRFTSRACGLANADAKCSCPRRLHAATAHRCVTPGHIVYANPDAPGYGATAEVVNTVIEELKVLKLQQATGFHRSPKDYRSIIHDLGNQAIPQTKAGEV